MNTVIVILGPTASGKTKYSIELAKLLGGEIISADSMQVYKYMDVGTAKPSIEERQGIKHYLLDEVVPDEKFSVAKYQQMAFNYIDEVSANGKIPIVVGGTGLYINSLIYNIEFSETVCDWELREKLSREAYEKGNEYLYGMLKKIDPESAQRLHVNDTKRIIRALEVYWSTNKTISDHQKVSRLNPSKYNFIIIGLSIEREVLYERINRRVDLMIEGGLVDEVKKLVLSGYDKNTVAMQAIGYKEILAYLRGDYSLDYAIEIIKRDSRRYAKRQLTWFKRIENVFWVDVLKDGESSVLENMKYYLATQGVFL